MNIKQQIEDLLTANFEGLPLPDRLGAASALSTLYHYVVDNDLEQDYCSREPILAATDRCYTALLMSYINCDSAAQATKILLAQADLIFGLQAVPNRRRVDCFLSAATKHLTESVSNSKFKIQNSKLVSAKAQSPTPKSGSAAPSSLSLSFSYDHRSFIALASIVLTFGGTLPKEAEKHLATCEGSQAQCPMPHASRFSALQNTINKLEEEIQSSLLLEK